MEIAIFVLFAAVAAVSALIVVAHRNPVYSTMALVLTLFSVAVLFVLLGAPFLAALQILIYAGAIVVLFLFVIMLLNIQREEAPYHGQPVARWLAILGAALFCGMLGMLLFESHRGEVTTPLTEAMVSMQGLAADLFTIYLLPFEIVGLLLLVAVIAASAIARKLEPISPPASSPNAQPPAGADSRESRP